MDAQLRRSEIFIVTVTQKRKAPLGAAYEVVRMRFAPTEPFLDSLFWGAAAKEPPAKFDAGGPQYPF